MEARSHRGVVDHGASNKTRSGGRFRRVGEAPVDWIGRIR